MNVTAIIQARMTSTRLPGKILKKVMGKPLLAYMVARVKEAKSVSGVVIATTDNPEDDAVAELATKLRVPVFRGSEEDVLERFYLAAKCYGGEFIMRLTGDCPLIDPELIDELVRFVEQGNYDYASNCLDPTLPDGLDAEVFTFSALQEAYQFALLPSEREHVTPFIRKQTGHLRIGSWRYKHDLSGHRWTVDEPDDYDFVCCVIEHLYPINKSFRIKDVLDFLEKNPRISEINRQHRRNEGLIKSLRKDEEYLQRTKDKK